MAPVMCIHLSIMNVVCHKSLITSSARCCDPPDRLRSSVHASSHLLCSWWWKWLLTCYLGHRRPLSPPHGLPSPARRSRRPNIGRAWLVFDGAGEGEPVISFSIRRHHSRFIICSLPEIINIYFLDTEFNQCLMFTGMQRMVNDNFIWRWLSYIPLPKGENCFTP